MDKNLEFEPDNIYRKLSLIQCELHAPKNQYNSFGKYKYRSCEDILEGVKPICRKHNAVLVIKDDIVLIDGRYYVKATCTLYDCDSDDFIENYAYAREEESKKGMDGSQVTGATSSYARKYALNGLLNIDDSKDADTDEYANESNNREQKYSNVKNNEQKSKKQANKANEQASAYEQLNDDDIQEKNYFLGLISNYQNSLEKPSAKYTDFVSVIKKHQATQQVSKVTELNISHLQGACRDLGIKF